MTPRTERPQTELFSSSALIQTLLHNSRIHCLGAYEHIHAYKLTQINYRCLKTCQPMCKHTPTDTRTQIQPSTKTYPGTIFICASTPSCLLSPPLSPTLYGASRPALSQYIPLYSLSLSFPPRLCSSFALLLSSLSLPL